MNSFANIRKQLGVTQAVMASAINVSQGNVSFYERGQTVPPDVAKRLIEFARERGLELTYDAIYGEPQDDAVDPAVASAPAPQGV